MLNSFYLFIIPFVVVCIYIAVKFYLYREKIRNLETNAYLDNENAVNNGYFTIQNNQLFDANPSPNARVNFKYIFNQAFAAVPTETVSKIKGAISLTFNPTLLFTNSNQNITQVWIDFLDGQGFNEVITNGTITKYYTDSSGDKKFNIKVQCSNGNIFYTTSQQ